MAVLDTAQLNANLPDNTAGSILPTNIRDIVDSCFNRVDDANDFDVAGSASTAQAYSIQRAHHTGTQGWSTITGTPTSLSGYGINSISCDGGAITSNGSGTFSCTNAYVYENLILNGPASILQVNSRDGTADFGMFAIHNTWVVWNGSNSPVQFGSSGSLHVGQIAHPATARTTPGIYCDGITHLDNGAITSDGNGNMVVGATPGHGSLTVNNSLSVVLATQLDDAAITTDGNGSMSMYGSLSINNGKITTDTGGNLHMTLGTLTSAGINVGGGGASLDNGAITTNGSGNMTVNGNLQQNGSITCGGNLVLTGLGSSDPHVVGQLWNNSGVLQVSAG